MYDSSMSSMYSPSDRPISARQSANAASVWGVMLQKKRCQFRRRVPRSMASFSADVPSRHQLTLRDVEDGRKRPNFLEGGHLFPQLDLEEPFLLHTGSDRQRVTRVA